MVEVKYTPKKPRVERDRTVSPDKQHRLRLKKGVKDTPETQILRMEGRRRKFVAEHPLKEGELYLSWITPKKPPKGFKGGRRHAVIFEAETLEISRDGMHWLEVVNLTESIEKGLNAEETGDVESEETDPSRKAPQGIG